MNNHAFRQQQNEMRFDKSNKRRVYKLSQGFITFMLILTFFLPSQSTTAKAKASELNVDTSHYEVVALQSDLSGKYVRAGVTNNSLLAAASDSVMGWETFKLIWLESGKVALQSTLSGKYVRAGVTSNSLLAAVSDDISDWETFYLSWHGYNKISLQPRPTGKYVRAGFTNSSLLAAISDAQLGWETFRLVWLDSHRYYLTGPSGGTGGESFNDKSDLPVRESEIRRIMLNSGDFIDGFYVSNRFADQTWSELKWHGGRGGSTYTFSLVFPEEVLTSIEGTYGEYVNQIEFGTNLGRHSPLYGGTPGPLKFKYQSSPGCRIVAFYGRSGNYIDAIGVVFKCNR